MTNDSSDSSGPSSHQKKIIQPSREFIAEMAASQASDAPQARQTDVQSSAEPADLSLDAPSDIAASPSPSHIEHAHKAEPPPPNHHQPREPEPRPGFKDGFRIGGPIFWLQLLVLIILAVLFALVSTIVLPTLGLNLLVLFIAGITCQLVVVLIVVYAVPHYRLRYEGIDDAFWLTVFAAVLQAFVSGTIVICLLLVLLAQLRLGSSSSVLRTLSLISRMASIAASQPVISIGIAISSLVVAYYETKLLWGTVFVIYRSNAGRWSVKIIDTIVLVSVPVSIALNFLNRY